MAYGYKMVGVLMWVCYAGTVDALCQMWSRKAEMIAPPIMGVDITRDYLMTVRQALLLELEAIEKLLDITPRTSEIRKAAKDKAYIEAERKPGEQ